MIVPAAGFGRHGATVCGEVPWAMHLKGLGAQAIWGMIGCFPSAPYGVEYLAESTEEKGRCPLAGRQSGAWGGLAWLACGGEGFETSLARSGMTGIGGGAGPPECRLGEAKGRQRGRPRGVVEVESSAPAGRLAHEFCGINWKLTATSDI